MVSQKFMLTPLSSPSPNPCLCLSSQPYEAQYFPIFTPSVQPIYAFSSLATFFLNNLFFNLSAKPSGCFGALESATWTLPSPPRPVWKFSFSMLGRRATSGIAMSSLRWVAATFGDPMLAAPPLPVLKAPSP